MHDVVPGNRGFLLRDSGPPLFPGKKAQLRLAAEPGLSVNRVRLPFGSFTTALLKGLHQHKSEAVTQERLAEEAVHIELDVLHQPLDVLAQLDADLEGLTAEQVRHIRFEADKLFIESPPMPHPNQNNRVMRVIVIWDREK